jgi:hypothetical protein
MLFLLTFVDAFLFGLKPDKITHNLHEILEGF